MSQGSVNFENMNESRIRLKEKPEQNTQPLKWRGKHCCF